MNDLGLTMRVLDADLATVWDDDQPIAREIWETKYRHADGDGSSAEAHPLDTVRRVVDGVYAGDPDAPAREAAFRTIAERRFVPAGRIWSAAGTVKHTTMVNCFVMDTLPDDLGGIFRVLGESALTMQAGGGIGVDFSTLRPKGAWLVRTHSTASGPISFMDAWDAMCGTIMSAGHRRGAMMATLRCDHPDVLDFIEAKHRAGRLTNFNVSVLVTDAFMAAVDAGGMWALGFGKPRFDGRHEGVETRDGEPWYVYRRLPARELWDAILRSTYEYAEPGVIFIDRINAANNLAYCETIASTNPCFTGDTLVWTDRGPRRFDDLAAAGETVRVLTLREDDVLAYEAMERPRKTRSMADIVEVRLSDGSGIRCTPEHEFFLEDGVRVEAQHLLPGTPLSVPYEGDILTVDDVEHLDGKHDVYCGTVPGTGRFYLALPEGSGTGVLVSNCGEEPLPPYGDCILGAVNLARVVTRPWTEHADLDAAALRQAVQVGVRFLDNVIDATLYPLVEQNAEAKDKRRIGLGVMGLASMLQQLGIGYATPEGRRTVHMVMEEFANAAYRASAALAKERGPFPLWNHAEFMRAPFVRKLHHFTRQEIAEHGIRNGVVLTVAPTGTTSILAGNVSSGIEPVFALRYDRAIRQPDDSYRSQPVADWGWMQWCRANGLDPATTPLELAPEFMATALSIPPEAHVAMQGAVQKWIDASISKTINCPADMSFDAFRTVYDEAWAAGCKGCTTYRPSAVRGAVLTAEAPAQPAVPEIEAAAPAAPALWQRPRVLDARTYKVRPGEHACYVTVTDDGDRPREVFITTKDASLVDWTQTVGRLLSAMMRHGLDVRFAAEELQEVHSARGGWWEDGRYHVSLPAAIGATLAEHMDWLVASRDPDFAEVEDDALTLQDRTRRFVTDVWRDADAADAAAVTGEPCPKCQQAAVVRQDGCRTCRSCGWSSCA